MMRRSRAFTLVELLIVIAVAAILMMLAAPSFRDMILMQRLRSINAQIVTDFQLARSEAVARGTLVRMLFSFPNESAVTCYTIYTADSNFDVCDCLNGPGAACNGVAAQEIRTVQVERSLAVTLSVPAGIDPGLAFDPVSGGIVTIRLDEPSAPMDSFAVDTRIDTPRALRTLLNSTGRPRVCAPSGSKIDVPACP